jgi:hypothetical protein
MLGSMLAMLAAAGAIAFEKLEVAQQRSARAHSIDPAILSAHLQNIQGEIAVP